MHHKPEILKDKPIGAYTTFGFDVKARHYATFHNEEELSYLINQHQKPIYILGGGSNICFTGDVDAFVLHNQIQGITIIDENIHEVVIEVGAGVNWHVLVLWCLENDFGGLENLSLIPGTVGAAPMQNIGAYGVELKDVFVSLDAMDIATGAISTFDHEACRFGYRDSIFKQEYKGKYIILKVRLRLTKAPHQLNLDYGAIRETLADHQVNEPDIRDVSKAVIAIRQSKLPDPAQIGNAGSFFKNPVIDQNQMDQLLVKFPNMVHFPQQDGQVKVPAGWLIEQCGWKGYRSDQIGCHKDQALVLVHYGGGKGEDLVRLANLIKDSVQVKFGIEIQPEVNIV